MPDVFTKTKRSEVMSRIRSALRQLLGRSGEITPDESGPQRVGAVGLIENPTLRRAHVVHGLFQHAGGVGQFHMPRNLEAPLPKSGAMFPRCSGPRLNPSTLNRQPSTDLMADVFSKRKRSEVMSRIRGRGNSPTTP